MKTPLILLSGNIPLVDIDGTVFVQFGIFLIMLVFLTKFVFKPYLALLRERGENIEGAKEEATRVNTDADVKLSSYEEQIVKARKEAASVRAEHRGEGESRAQELLAEARKESDTKLEAARLKIEKSAQAAQLALRTRADQIAKTVASKLLGREV